MEADSFFGFFTFNNLEHDAIDYGLCYHACTIEKDFIVPGKVTLSTTFPGFKFKKGKMFHNIYLMLNRQELLFINWDWKTTHPVKTIEEIAIPLSAIGHMLKWGS